LFKPAATHSVSNRALRAPLLLEHSSGPNEEVGAQCYGWYHASGQRVLAPSTRKLNRKVARLAEVLTAANAASGAELASRPSSAVCTVTVSGAAAAPRAPQGSSKQPGPVCER